MKTAIIATFIVFFSICTFLSGCTSGQDSSSKSSVSSNKSSISSSNQASQTREASLASSKSDKRAPASSVIVNPTPDASALAAWVGEYQFSEFTPPDIMMMYSASIYCENGGCYARIDVDGHMTTNRILAKVKGDSQSISLIFDSYYGEVLQSPNIYKQGEVLLSFEKTDKEMITYWGTLSPIIADNRSPGYYFKAVHVQDKSNSTNRTTSSSELSAWLGDYLYNEKDTSGVIENFYISVYKDDSAYYAKINMSGQQTYKTITAIVQGDSHSIGMSLVSYDGNILSTPFYETQVLLNLKKTDSGIMTYWGAISAVNQNPGYYFASRGNTQLTAPQASKTSTGNKTTSSHVENATGNNNVWAKPGSNINSKFTTALDNWIYYSNNGLYRMHTDGSAKQKLSDDQGFYLFTKDNWLYYSNANDGYSLYRIKNDGSGRQQLSSDTVGYINITDGWLYYCCGISSGSIYRIKTDGSDKQLLYDNNARFMSVSGDWIYYCANNDFGGLSLYRMKTDGSKQQKISDAEADYMVVVGNWIYCSDLNDGGQIVKISTDGSTNQLICDDTPLNINVSGDWIYYLNFQDRKLYKVKTDRSGKQLLCDDKVYYFSVAGDWVYYVSDPAQGGDGKFYRIKTDGTQKQLV